MSTSAAVVLPPPPNAGPSAGHVSAYRRLETAVQANASAAAMAAALGSLPDVGVVTVTRRGPSAAGELEWLVTLAGAVQGELDRVSQTLTGRIRQLAERYAAPLPEIISEVETLAARVDGHLQKMLSKP